MSCIRAQNGAWCEVIEACALPIDDPDVESMLEGCTAAAEIKSYPMDDTPLMYGGCTEILPEYACTAGNSADI